MNVYHRITKPQHSVLVLITCAKLWKLDSLKTLSSSHAELQPDIWGIKFLYSSVDVHEAYVAQNYVSLDLSPKLV